MNSNSKRAYKDFLANMKYKEIAKKYGVSINTVEYFVNTKLEEVEK